MVRDGFDARKYIDQVAIWLRELVQKSGCRGVVVGLSGGIDSAVVAGICQQAFPDPKQRLGVIMPCQSNPQDAEHGKAVAVAFEMPYVIADLSPTYSTLVQTLGDPFKGEGSGLARANIKSRLRMVTLYAQANIMGGMVIGTSNADEMYVGYFTKFGDGGCDVELISELTKEEVRECAYKLGVPIPIIDKPPSAGLWDGQTDEKEMGFTYNDLDKMVLKKGYSKNVPADVAEKIYRMHDMSEHKRALPPSPHFLK